MEELIERIQTAAFLEDWATVADVSWEILLHPDATEWHKMLAKHLRTTSQRLFLIDAAKD